MKIEFKQKQTEELPLNNLKAGDFISLATATSKQLGWAIGDVNETGFVAYTNNGLFAWNAEVKMKITNGSAILQSQSMGNEPKDIAGNKNNIQIFISAFKDLKRQYYPVQQHQYVEA
jgi:rhomboid protease GluP